MIRATHLAPALLAAVAATAVPAAAQERVPAPAYFVASTFAVSTAQAVARACPALSVDPVAAAGATGDVLVRLEADGFTPDNLETRMADPTDAIAARQRAFLDRHDLADGAPAGRVCAAGRAEIAEGSDVGALLVEVEG